MALRNQKKNIGSILYVNGDSIMPGWIAEFLLKLKGEYGLEVAILAEEALWEILKSTTKLPGCYGESIASLLSSYQKAQHKHT